MNDYRNNGSHPVDLTGGQVLAPQEVVRLSAEAEKDPHNASLIADGVLTHITHQSKKEEK